MKCNPGSLEVSVVWRAECRCVPSAVNHFAFSYKASTSKPFRPSAAKNFFESSTRKVIAALSLAVTRAPSITPICCQISLFECPPAASIRFLTPTTKAVVSLSLAPVKRRLKASSGRSVLVWVPPAGTSCLCSFGEIISCSSLVISACSV